jgi:uncharacterized protein (DUF924 family)
MNKPLPHVDDLHTFWFGAFANGQADADTRRNWFAGGPAFDERIRARFAELPEAAAAGALDDWLDSTRGQLCWIIACDQLPRNLFRGTRRAFEFDPMALAAARRLIESGADLALSLDERSFVYMPFEHSEAILDQHTAVGLFTALEEAAGEAASGVDGWARYAREHRDLIVRFGRFPHRNAVLGRESTAAERDYLAHGSTFGQG